MSEEQRLIDFLDAKIDDVRDSVREDLRVLTEKVERHLAQPEKCAARFEEKFVSKSKFRLLLAAIGAGFLVVFTLISILHSPSEVAARLPQAIIDSAK